jgi:hypothetical protein
LESVPFTPLRENNGKKNPSVSLRLVTAYGAIPLVSAFRREAGSGSCKQPTDDGWLGREFCVFWWLRLFSRVDLLFFNARAAGFCSSLFHVSVVHASALAL